MKKTILAVIAAASLAACNGSGKGALTEAQIDAVKVATLALCQFVPTSIGIDAVVPGTPSYIVPISVIAKAICDAVSKQGSLAKGEEVTTKVVVDGKETIVSTQGYFVPKVEDKKK